MSKPVDPVYLPDDGDDSGRSVPHPNRFPGDDANTVRYLAAASGRRFQIGPDGIKPELDDDVIDPDVFQDYARNYNEF